MSKRSCTRCFHCESCAYIHSFSVIYAMNAELCPHYLAVPEPEDFAKQIQDLEKLKDIELKHTLMDDRLCDLLNQLGYSEAVEIFKKAIKWYG